MYSDRIRTQEFRQDPVPRVQTGSGSKSSDRIRIQVFRQDSDPSIHTGSGLKYLDRIRIRIQMPLFSTRTKIHAFLSLYSKNTSLLIQKDISRSFLHFTRQERFLFCSRCVFDYCAHLAVISVIRILMQCRKKSNKEK